MPAWHTNGVDQAFIYDLVTPTFNTPVSLMGWFKWTTADRTAGGGVTESLMTVCEHLDGVNQCAVEMIATVVTGLDCLSVRARDRSGVTQLNYFIDALDLWIPFVVVLAGTGAANYRFYIGDPAFILQPSGTFNRTITAFRKLAIGGTGIYTNNTTIFSKGRSSLSHYGVAGSDVSLTSGFLTDFMTNQFTIPALIEKYPAQNWKFAPLNVGDGRLQNFALPAGCIGASPTVTLGADGGPQSITDVPGMVYPNVGNALQVITRRAARQYQMNATPQVFHNGLF